ncbi:ubinuclein-1 isoform X2 [Centruroides vittatus]|uniref:ubinuclein-1 isoform X2 n=1 Tax=Centruroides vittatus TaxID=120091 RepID=UPI00350F3231
MAEPRRIPFDTVKSLAKEKKAKDQPPTQRFSLTLDESNDKTCPEYSYSDLMKTARDDKKEPVQDDTPFGDDDDDNDDKLRELARKFEEKYGPKIGKKKKKKFGKWEDYIDRGMGYDENDSFIDNDEAYDELVPSTLTTQYGGFYINSGGLEFRAVSDSDSEEFTDEQKPRKKKRRLIDKDTRRRRRLKEGEHVPKKRGRRPLDKSFSALQLSRKKRQPTVAALLQQHKSQLQVEPIVNENSFQSENGEECAEDNVKGDISLNEIVDSVVKSNEERVNNGNAALTAGSSDSDEHIRLAIEQINAPKLPDNLSSDLEAMITKLKQIAFVSDEGKCKFFSRDVNNMLLSVELKSRELPCSQRSMIYSHLASHLPCTKETLLKRAKKLRMDQEMEKLREPLNRLKEAIGKILPGILDKYIADCKLVETKLENEKEKKGEENNENDKEKSAKFPQKEFQWNDEIRKLLCDLVRTKVRWYETSKVRNQSAEEYIWQFLESEVKELWPAGWMKTKHLYKESKEAHGYLTNKPKKPMLVQRKPGIPLGIQVPVVPAGRLTSSVVLSPIATGQELAEGMSNMKVPTTSGDDGESLGTLIAVTTANSALSEEQKPHILPEVSSVLPSRAISVVTSSVPLQQSDKEAPSSTVSAKSNVSSEIKSTGHTVQENKSSISLSQIGSPSKRIFTLINSGDAAQLQAQQASQQTSLASQMLDRIICASLANFPNSGSSTTEPGRYKPLSIGRDLNATEQNVRPSPKSALEVSQPKLDCVSVKPPSPAKVDTQVGSPSTLIRSPSIGVSILKSSYQSPTEQRQIHGRTTSLPEQTKGLTTTLVGNTSVSSRKFQSIPVTTSANTVNTRKTEELKMPFHSYEFLEAFKRTLESSPEPLQPRSESSTVLSSSKVKTALSENTRELCDEPMNFKKLQSSVDSVSSLIPQDFSSKQDNPTVVHLSGTYKRSNPQVRSMQLTNSLRVQRSSPETVSTPVSFPEGMKGFPLPIKSQSTNPSCISSLSTTNPTHGLVSRTSPAQAHEPGFTSPHRHNSPSPHRSVSAHSPSHGHPSSAGNSASHNPYQSTPLSHYPPVETTHNRTMLQNQWRANSPSTTTNYSSQYSTSCPSPNTSSPTSQTYQNPSQNPVGHHHHNAMRAQGGSTPQVGSYGQTVHNISQQLTPAHNVSHKTVDSHNYSQQSSIIPNRHTMNSVWQQNPSRTPSNNQSFPNSAIVGPQGSEYPGQRSTQQTSHHRIP